MAKSRLLTASAGTRALILARPSIERAIEVCLRRNALHVVILNPSVKYYPRRSLPVLAEQTFGEQNKGKWIRPFDEIARSKAEVCWREGMSTREIGEKAPYLYRSGDTKFPGGVICDGLVVAASGLEWQFDEACCHVVIAFFWAITRMARDADLADTEIIFLEE